MELLVIRHAEPVRVEASDRRADPSLTPRGQEQARLLARWLAPEGIAAVYSSPAARARETAAPVAAAAGVDVRVLDGVDEYDREATSYIPIEEMRARGGPEWEALAEGRLGDLTPAATTAFRDRVVAAMEQVIAAHPGGRVAVVAHGGVQNVYVGHLLGRPPTLWFEPGYAAICRIAASTRSHHRTVVALNERPDVIHARVLAAGFGTAAVG